MATHRRQPLVLRPVVRAQLTDAKPCGKRTSGGVFKQYLQARLVSAVDMTKKMSDRAAARIMEVPRSTIGDWSRKQANEGMEASAPALRGHGVLSGPQEGALLDLVRLQAERVDCFTCRELQEAAFKLAMAHPPTDSRALKALESWKKTGRASEKWWRGFRARHAELKFNVPNELELPRTTITQAELDAFLAKVEDLIREYPHLADPAYWFDTDETPLNWGGRTKKVLTVPGVPPNKKTTTNDKLRITCLPVICGDGSQLPPVIITKGKLLTQPAWWGELADVFEGSTLQEALCYCQARRVEPHRPF